MYLNILNNKWNILYLVIRIDIAQIKKYMFDIALNYIKHIFFCIFQGNQIALY